MAKFCSQCGNLLEDGDKFCGNCGAPVEAAPVKEKVQEKTPERTQETAPADAAAKEIKEAKEVKKEKLPERALSAREGLYSSLQKTARSPRKDRTLGEKYFSYEGRLNRKRYFLRSLALWLVCVFLGSILAVLFAPIGFVAAAILLISSVMLSIRRLHDLNKSGWFVLISFIPVIGFFWGLYLLFAKGTAGDNDYGADPLDIQDQDISDFS